MMNKIYLISFLILFIFYVQCRSIDNQPAYVQGKISSDITKHANRILNEISTRILEKEHKIPHEPKASAREGVDGDEEDGASDTFQGDILLTEKQAKRLIEQAVKEAEAKDVDISDINTDLD